MKKFIIIAVIKSHVYKMYIKPTNKIRLKLILIMVLTTTAVFIPLLLILFFAFSFLKKIVNKYFTVKPQKEVILINEFLPAFV